jgi:hypothetical protein
MNRVATLVVAIIGLAMTACSLDKPAESAEREGAEIRLAGAMPVADKPDEIIDDPVVEAETDTSVAMDSASLEAAKDRDAKEAAEEAARRIRDATLGAAARIKEVGLGAVQAVRESSSGNEQPLADTGSSADES